jgi:YHS domain-containing protein
VSAGIDGALCVVEELRGHDEAISVAHLMQYDKWEPGAGVVLGKSGIRPPAPLAASMTRDPVCLMAIPSKDAPTLAYQGVTYYFCSAGCRDNFRRHPKEYAKNSPRRAQRKPSPARQLDTPRHISRSTIVAR